MANKTFYVELIKPSHYDSDGYVIQWHKSWIPSNSLASVYGLTRDVAERKVLGDDVDIVFEAYDETNAVIPIKGIISRFKENANSGIVCFVGVQTNQFPRTFDMARELRQAGIQVAIGGFHVSGCMSMLPELPPDLQTAQDMGITFFAGEGEGRLGDFYCAAYEGTLEPVYNYVQDLPDMDGQTTPFLPKRYIDRYIGKTGCFDAGRGCPFTCSFCTIINVQGRQSRFRDADDVERLIRKHVEQGIRSFVVTDDNFARNKNWEPIFDRLIALRKNHKVKVKLFLQVDALAHKIPNFIDKAVRAGCTKVYIGLENINPDNLKSASKGQNRITEYRKMLQNWRDAGAITYCGYILGFPADTPESIERDIGVVQRELPIDLLEFFILTPLPGSADHKELYLKGQWMDPDMNKYDLENVTTEHAQMTPEEVQDIYHRAWDLYYTWDHIETLLKRSVASGLRPIRLAEFIAEFYGSYRFERLHPLQAGFFRRKIRTQRRHGLPLENPLVFYPRRLWEMFRTYIPAAAFFWKMVRVRNRIMRDESIKENYTDIAIAPVPDDDTEDLEMYHITEAAEKSVAKLKAKEKMIRDVRERAAASA